MLPITAHPRIVSLVARQQDRERAYKAERRRRQARSLRTQPSPKQNPAPTPLRQPVALRLWFILRPRRSAS